MSQFKLQAKEIMFKKGDQVEILPEFQDSGDDRFFWVVLDDEEKGRVDIYPLNTNLLIKPRFTVGIQQIRLLPADVQTLAFEFSASLRVLLSSEEMQQVILRNAAETHPNICHSHDFCDANVVMHEVFLAHGMDPADEGGVARWGNLWDAAWSLAKARDFDVAGIRPP